MSVARPHAVPVQVPPNRSPRSSEDQSSSYSESVGFGPFRTPSADSQPEVRTPSASSPIASSNDDVRPAPSLNSVKSGSSISLDSYYNKAPSPNNPAANPRLSSPNSVPHTEKRDSDPSRLSSVPDGHSLETDTSIGHYPFRESVGAPTPKIEEVARTSPARNPRTHLHPAFVVPALDPEGVSRPPELPGEQANSTMADRTTRRQGGLMEGDFANVTVMRLFREIMQGQDTIRSDHKAGLEAMQSTHQEALEAMQSTHQDALEAMQSTHQDALEAVVKRLDVIEADIETIKGEGQKINRKIDNSASLLQRVLPPWKRHP